jgi:hypothetical protein
LNPQAILAAVPWLRRLWRITPPQLRVPLLLVVALIGLAQFISGRKQDEGAPRVTPEERDEIRSRFS